MRLSDFWNRMDARFGPVYARSVAADYRLPELSMTVDKALESGIAAKTVWRAVCAEFGAPAQLH